jgi:WD40 repeat protein
MIEGEEIFESAQETGYRLCRSRESENDCQELVFSASWDLNIPHRLFVCMQNGELKTYNVEDKSSERFKVMFRRYTPMFDTDSQIEKPVNHHWDKMTTIPDRPDEMIFLLGISNKLMYTALPPPESNPYPMQPLLASTARGDIPGFIFGAPVMEISSHQSRITALSVSPAGHILASGDENGKVRLLLLRLLDEISVFKQNERQRKKHTAATNC